MGSSQSVKFVKVFSLKGFPLYYGIMLFCTADLLFQIPHVFTLHEESLKAYQYRIRLTKHCGYYLFEFVWRLFESGDYSRGAFINTSSCQSGNP